MRDNSETPPLHYSPLTSDRERLSTRENTPLGTPTLTTFPGARVDKTDYLSWQPRKSGLYLDSTLLEIKRSENDLDSDLLFPPFSSSPPLFPSSPPVATMATRASPIDITRQTSASPRGQRASNLTSALQGANGVHHSLDDPNLNDSSSNGYKAPSARHDSVSGATPLWGNGTTPISMNNSGREKPRRESIAGSLVGGMSWGGVSVSSWIRDDIIMAGTSPFTIQSPSYHSSSYLPKLEANFMRDFSCCGMTLASLHDLLQHYEEAHASKPTQPLERHHPSIPDPSPDSRAAIAAGAAAAVQQQAQMQQQQSQITSATQPQDSRTSPSSAMGGLPTPTKTHSQLSAMQNRAQSQPPQDLDGVEDMEMDDAIGETETTPPPQMFRQNRMPPSTQTPFSTQNSSRVTPLNMNLMQSQQSLRNSQPTTPVNPGRPGFTNPTVSSVNTPTFATHPLQQQQAAQYRNTPDSSSPGTPGELDDGLLGGMGDMSMYGNQMAQQGHRQNIGYDDIGNGDMLNLYIDQPAKRLYSPNGGYNNQQQFPQMRLGNGAQYGPNSEVARHIREQQMAVGLADTASGLLPNEEPKPFRCPVIGCEKAYKNQNGLKYHKSHGHNNQQLHDNADGTFSIVNPETSTPYPGTLGMEKEKPYRCEVCGKRYKNLNGLKYHRAHSPPCNPDSQLAAAGKSAVLAGVMQGQNINIAGAGLPGIGEESLV